MFRLHGLTPKRLVLGGGLALLAVAMLAPRGNYGEQCCICGLTRRTWTVAGITYWSAPERMSGCEGLHEWYLQHVGVSHRHHWHRVSGNTSWLWWGLHSDGIASAYALYPLAVNSRGWAPEEQKAFIEKYATVKSCEDVRRFYFEYHGTEAPTPEAERRSGD